MATLLLLAVLGVQTSSRVSGLVTDATALPLPGATVELDGRVVAISDGRGAFEIILPGGAPLRLRVTLDGFEPRLDSSQFLRIHRSAIVRLDQIAEVQPAGSSRYRVTLLDGTTLVVSRSRAAALKGLIL